MGFGVDFLALGGLLVLAADPVSCQLPQAPVVTVSPRTAEIQYDFSKSVSDLGRIQPDTISPYGAHAEQMMLGLHEGRILVEVETSLKSISYPSLKVGCLHYDTVTVRISLNPKIYVIRELPPRTCAHNVVLEHELKHVQVDRDIVNLYGQKIGQAVQDAINRMGTVGPYPLRDVAKAQERMTGSIAMTVRALESNLLEDQYRRQQAVDSLEEYERIGRVIREDCRYDIEKKLGRHVAGSMKKKR